MGGFYGSVQLRTEDRARVLAAAEAVATDRGIKCLVGPLLNGWVGVYPEGSGQDETVGRQIAERAGGHAIHLLVHDDDILAYWLWAEGKLIDRYHSSPGYFGEENRAEEEPLVGDAKQFAFVLGAAGQAKLAKLIDRDAKEVFEVERLKRLGRLLKIENVLTSYEYLQESDGSPVKGRRQFAELPADGAAEAKRIAEKAAKAAETKRFRDERKRFKAEGKLLAHFADAHFFGRVAAVSGGFLRFPAPHYYDRPSSLNLHSPPWKVALTVGFDLPPRSNPFNVIADLSGRRVAAQADHAIRVWDWDGIGVSWLSDLPTAPFTSVSAISGDGELMAVNARVDSSSMNVVTVHEVSSQRVLAKLEIKNLSGLAFEPGGKALVIASGSIDWVDLFDPKQHRQFKLDGPVPDRVRTATDRELALKHAAAIANKIKSVQDELSELQARQAGPKPLPPEEAIQTEVWAESLVNRLQKQLRSLTEDRPLREQPALAEQVSCIGFSRDGQWFWCGSERRLQVFKTAEFAGRTAGTPKPVYAAKAPGDSDYAHVHTFVEEVGGAAVVFAGTGGYVMRLDLKCGIVSVLVQIPGATSITGLAMSLDGQQLCVTSMENRTGSRQLNCWFQVWDYVRLLG